MHFLIISEKTDKTKSPLDLPRNIQKTMGLYAEKGSLCDSRCNLHTDPKGHKGMRQFIGLAMINLGKLWYSENLFPFSVFTPTKGGKDLPNTKSYARVRFTFQTF